MSELESNIEEIIFCSPKPIKIDDIQKIFFEYDKKKYEFKSIQSVIQNLTNKYQHNNYAIEIIESGGGFQFFTKNKFSRLNEILLKQQSKRRLSISALETLSIIAYKQPVTKSDVEKIRGVNCDYTIQKLLDKEFEELENGRNLYRKIYLNIESHDFSYLFNNSWKSPVNIYKIIEDVMNIYHL